MLTMGQASSVYTYVGAGLNSIQFKFTSSKMALCNGIPRDLQLRHMTLCNCYGERLEVCHYHVDLAYMTKGRPHLTGR